MTPDRVWDEAEALSFPCPRLFSLLELLFPQILTLAFLTLLSFRAQFTRNLLWRQPLGHPWLYDTMVVCQALHFPLSGLLSHFLSLLWVCVHIMYQSLSPYLSPPSKGMDPQGSFLSLVYHGPGTQFVVSTELLMEWLRVCVHIPCLWERFFFFSLKLDTTKQTLSWGGVT